MADLELNRRLAAIEAQLVKVQKIEIALRDRPAVAERREAGLVVDVLPGLSLVFVLLAELHDQGERLRHLEVNLRCREANARRRATAIDNGQPRRPVGRPRKVKPDGLEASSPA